jgi:hypothetical protein
VPVERQANGPLERGDSIVSSAERNTGALTDWAGRSCNNWFYLASHYCLDSTAQTQPVRVQLGAILPLVSKNSHSG